MAELTTQYTDTKNITHTVQHLTLSNDDNAEKEQLTAELYRALTKAKSRVDEHNKPKE